MAGQAEVAQAFIREHERRLKNSRDVLDRFAEEIGNEMRKNARWEDRTANARASLQGLTEYKSDVLRLIAKGGGPPDYVKFLELAHAGKYAIVWPTLFAYSGRIFQALSEIWGAR